mgnify:CR=1 FL=1
MEDVGTVSNERQKGDGAIVVLTGAGISKESGLATFRDADGIWSKVRIEDVATPEAFARDPARVDAFYDERRRQLLSAAVAPNAAHHALARLEAQWPGPFLLATQNIDDLHERAGSRSLLHMHGELLSAWCRACDGRFPWRRNLSRADRCPGCGETGRLRVDVVWFGEMPYGLERAYQALSRCSLFLSIGTSGNVYPAAGFVAEARANGARTVELNLEPSEGHGLFHESRHGPASEIVPGFVDALLAAVR